VRYVQEGSRMNNSCGITMDVRSRRFSFSIYEFHAHLYINYFCFVKHLTKTKTK